MSLELRRPSPDLAASFAEMRDAFIAVGDNRWSPPNNLEITAIALTDVLGYIDLLDDWANGKNLPEGWVPGDEFWIIKDGIVVGSVGIRHRLNDWLRRVGGHIGYAVHPGYRNQGVATFALREALRALALLGEPEALITCSDDNAASARVIEKCGGVRIADSTTRSGVCKRRYLISLEEPVILAAYDSNWPKLFEREAVALRAALAPYGLQKIEHIGSTAIPRMTAKPIVDILAGVTSVGDIPPRGDFWSALGYAWGHGEKRPDDWLYFIKRDPAGRRAIHLHVTTYQGAFWENHIAFRDALRLNPGKAEEYARLKVTLARDHARDRVRYTQEKAGFVTSLLGVLKS